jgi:hypothetical protein
MDRSQRQQSFIQFGHFVVVLYATMPMSTMRSKIVSDEAHRSLASIDLAARLAQSPALNRAGEKAVY